MATIMFFSYLQGHSLFPLPRIFPRLIESSESGTYSATYIISNNDAGTGKVINTVTVNASSPGNNNDVTDISDDGDDSDGNTTNDPTIMKSFHCLK